VTAVAAPIATAAEDAEAPTATTATEDAEAPTATTAPTAQELPATAPTGSVSPIVLATRAPIGPNERWRQQELDRKPFETATRYTTTGTELYWYDPVFQQSVLLGTFGGDFDALATFTLRSSGQPCLEVLYEVNKRYGLTALSPAIVERIEAAGYTEGFIDTYVVLDERVAPKAR
jgi:hypothetical protein